MKMIAPTEYKVPLVHPKINRTPVNKDSIEAMTFETDKMVTGQFLNVEYPGQAAKIVAKLYKGMQIFNETLKDNETATIPLSVARHINERCYVQQHTHILDDQGNPLKGDKKIPRYKFVTAMA